MFSHFQTISPISYQRLQVLKNIKFHFPFLPAFKSKECLSGKAAQTEHKISIEWKTNAIFSNSLNLNCSSSQIIEVQRELRYRSIIFLSLKSEKNNLPGIRKEDEPNNYSHFKTKVLKEIIITGRNIPWLRSRRGLLFHFPKTEVDKKNRPLG